MKIYQEEQTQASWTQPRMCNINGKPTVKKIKHK